MRQQINMISLGVKDIEKSKDFYEKGLSWKAAKSSKTNYRIYDLGSFFMGLYPMAAFEEDTNLVYEATEFKGFTLSINAHSMEEVDEIMKQVDQIGGTIIKLGEEVSWGGYRGYFKDLDGYLFEVVFNPFWKLNKDGKLML